MKHKTQFDLLRKIGFLFLIFCLLAFVFYPQISRAGALTALSDTMSRLADSTPAAVYSDHTIRFTTPSGVAAAGEIEITMPTGFTIGSVDYTDIDVSWGASTGYENELDLAATCLTTTWGAAFTGQVLKITSCTGTITATNKVVVEIGQNATGGGVNLQIQNHATAATYTISIAGSFGDTGKMAIVILTNDQFTVTGTVDPTITLSLSANATDFGVISTSSPTTSSPDITLTVSTNAGSGYSITVRDAGDTSNPGIYNSDAAYLLASATADLSATSGYGIQCASASATCTAPYNVSGTNVGGYQLTAQTFATYDDTADGHTITITSKARAAGDSPAGSYNDTVTVIATGNF